MEREEAEGLSGSLREPQLTPSESCVTVLQDHGPNNGGWGPAAISLPWQAGPPIPFVYTGNDDHVIDVMTTLCRKMAQDTGKPTRLVCFTRREDLAIFGGSS